MQKKDTTTSLQFESELTARYQADLSGAHARAYLCELRQHKDLSQFSLDQQIDELLAQWRYSLLDVALAKQSSIPPLDLLKALVVIEAYDQAIALTENRIEELFTSQASILFDLGIFCLDQDPDHPKASLFFQHAFQSFTQHKKDNTVNIAIRAISFAKSLLERKRKTEAEQFFEIAFEIWELDKGNNLSILEAELIWILVELGSLERAEALLTEQPNNPYFLAGFGAALLALGQTERADNYLKQVCSLVQQDKRYNLGWILDFLAAHQYWDWAIALVSYIHKEFYSFRTFEIYSASLRAHAWTIAEQVCDLQSTESNKNGMLCNLVAGLVEQGCYLEAERVASRISEGSYHRDSAFKEIITAYAAVQRWSEARAIFRSITNFEEYPASLRSYLEMCIQEGALAEATSLLKKVYVVDDRLIVEIQLALAYHKQDPNTNVEVALNDLEERLLQLEAELEDPHNVWYELATAYTKLDQSNNRLQAFVRLGPKLELHSSEHSFFGYLVDQEDWQLAEQYTYLLPALEERNELLAQLCLLVAKRGEPIEVWRLMKRNLMSRWQETYHEKFSWLLYYLGDAYIKAGFLNEAKQLIPLIPSDDLRRDKVNQIIPAFSQKQNWNEVLGLLEAHQDDARTTYFYAQLYLALRRSGQHKLADGLAQATPFRDKLHQYNESQSRYKERYQKVAVIKQALARGKWKKAEQLLIQNFAPEYRAWFYKELSLALLPKKRWNELIRITHFVRNDTTMFWWYRIEAFERLLRGLVKAGRWRQALRLISTFETWDNNLPEEQPDQNGLIFALISALVEQSLFKQALSVYNEISDSGTKQQACVTIVIGLIKVDKWREAEPLLTEFNDDLEYKLSSSLQIATTLFSVNKCHQAEELLQELNSDLFAQYGHTVILRINNLLLECHRHQRFSTIDRLCEWVDGFITHTYYHKTYFTTLCLIGRSEQAEALAEGYISHSEGERALSYVVEGLLQIGAFDRAEQIALKLDHGGSNAVIAMDYAQQKLWDRLVSFADRAIRQADNYDKIQACQPLMMNLIALRPKKAQALVDLLTQELAFEQRLEDRVFATEGIRIAQ
jgi:hypothetical protein